MSKKDKANALLKNLGAGLGEMNKRYNTPKNRARLKSMGNGFNDFYSGDSGLSFGNADSGYSRPRKARRHKKRTSRAKHVRKPHYTISIRI